MENSKIEWTDHTFNPWIGCTKVGPGCDHCYAETLATARLGVAWGVGADRRRTAPGNWAKPRGWDRKAKAAGTRYRVFCSSLVDVFDNAAPDGARADLAALILATPNLDWLLLTKRIGNAAGMLKAMFPDGTPSHVWLGATIVNQAEADRDIPKLLATDAAVRFLSMEPLLGPVDLTDLTLRVEPGREPDGLAGLDALTGIHWDAEDTITGIYGSPDPRIDWIIVGGESGKDARPMHPDWARSLRDQCGAAGVPFLFKQWGEWAPGENCGGPLRRTERTADWFDGEWSFGAMTPGDADGLHTDDEPDLWRCGEKAAGRLLDGVQHDGVPE